MNSENKIVDLSADEIVGVSAGIVPLIALGVSLVALFGGGVAIGFNIGDSIQSRQWRKH